MMVLIITRLWYFTSLMYARGLGPENCVIVKDPCCVVMLIVVKTRQWSLTISIYARGPGPENYVIVPCRVIMWILIKTRQWSLTIIKALILCSIPGGDQMIKISVFPLHLKMNLVILAAKVVLFREETK